MALTDAAPLLVFDVNETLLDITTLEPLFQRLFGSGAVMREWFAQLVLYSQTMTLSGLYAPFGELGIGALHMIAEIHGKSVTAADAEELKERMITMPAHADVVPGLTRLREAGFRMVTLTNSAPSGIPSPVERAGIADFFEHAFTVDAVRRFKPAPETYAQVATEMGTEITNFCLVACHLWDTIGAQAAGGYGALVTRPGNALLPASGVPQPDFVAPDLVTLSQAFSDRWSDS